MPLAAGIFVNPPRSRLKLTNDVISSAFCVSVGRYHLPLLRQDRTKAQVKQTTPYRLTEFVTFCFAAVKYIEGK